MDEHPAWRLQADGPVRDEDGLVRFLNRVGICLWTPARSLDLPNLADMMDLAKPDDIWQTWFWKDDLHVAKRLYYGKLLGGRPTFVSPAMLPQMIAARGDVDPYTYHEQGRLTAEAVRVYDALVRCRDLPTSDLRREAGLAGKESKAAFENALTALGALFQICKTGITGRTRGTYSYRWGLVEDWAPAALAEAARMRPHDAARDIAKNLGRLGVTPSPGLWRRMFGWDAETVEALTLTAPVSAEP